MVMEVASGEGVDVGAFAGFGLGVFEVGLDLVVEFCFVL